MAAAAPDAEGAGEVPARLRRAEAVLAARCGRVLVVLERVCDARNAHAVMRTAEALGVQNVWLVKPLYRKNTTMAERAEAARSGGGGQGGGHGDELPQAMAPPDAKSQLRKFVEAGGAGDAARGAEPFYRIANIAPKGSADIWVTTVTVAGQPPFEGPPSRSRKEAERAAAAGCMRRLGGEPQMPAAAAAAAPAPSPAADSAEAESALPSSTSVTRGAERWLSVREFDTPGECVAALRAAGWAIWATDLSPGAVELSRAPPQGELPERIAVVIGSEISGVSAETLAAADRRVYLPMFGFTESFNLSVATALVVQRVFDWMGGKERGSLPPDEVRRLRADWMDSLGGNPTSRARIAAAAAAAGPDGAAAASPLEDLRRGAEGKEVRMLPKVRRKEQQMLRAGAAAPTAATDAGRSCGGASPAANFTLGAAAGCLAGVALCAAAGALRRR